MNRVNILKLFIFKILHLKQNIKVQWSWRFKSGPQKELITELKTAISEL